MRRCRGRWFLVAELFEHERQQDEKDDIGDLRQRHFLRHVLPLELREVGAEVHKVKVQRDADEEHAQDEDSEGGLFQQRQGIKAEHLTQRHILAFLLRRRGWQREGKEAKNDRGAACEVVLYG